MALTIPDSRPRDDAASPQKPFLIQRRGEPIDAHVAARGGCVDEILIVDDDADMQFLVREMHENEIAGAQVVSRYGQARTHLLTRGARHMNSGAARRVVHQPAAVEAAGRGAAVSIWLSAHGQREANHLGARVV